MAADLNGDRPKTRRTGVVVSRQWRNIALSDDGSRLAVIDGDKVVTYQLGSGDLLAAAKVANDFLPVMVRFVSRDVVAVLTLKSEKVSGDSSLERSHWKERKLDIEARDLDDGRVIDGPWRWVIPGWSNPFGYVLERLKSAEDDRLQLVDPATGAVVTDLGDMPGRWTNIEVVGDGKIVILREKGERYWLEVSGPDGRHLGRVDLPGGGWARLGGEVSPNLLAVGRTIWTRDGEVPARSSTQLVNIGDGTIERTLDGVSPVLGGWRFDTSPGAWSIGSVATRLMVGEGFTLLLWDPDNGELRRLVPHEG